MGVDHLISDDRVERTARAVWNVVVGTVAWAPTDEWAETAEANRVVEREGARAALREVLPEVAREVWDEGYTRGFYDREKLTGDSRDASEGSSENPYEKEQ